MNKARCLVVLRARQRSLWPPLLLVLVEGLLRSVCVCVSEGGTGALLLGGCERGSQQGSKLKAAFKRPETLTTGTKTKLTYVGKVYT